MEGETAPPSEVTGWSENLRLNIVSVDEEHRLLFKLAQRMQAGAVHEMLEDLHDYVQTHFQHEEALMESSHYPGQHGHVREHQRLAHLLSLWQKRADPWTEVQVQGFRSFLTRWLELHIHVHDLAFARWYVDFLNLQDARAAAV
jgi:hemerythrin-like metal-binding protein